MNRASRIVCGYLIAAMVVAFTITSPAQQPEVIQPEPDAATTLHHIKTVFLIVMENHNWTGAKSGNIKGNSAAPYIN